MTVNNNLSVFKVVNSIPWNRKQQHGDVSKNRSADAGELIKNFIQLT